jgi:hypothetical protein
LLAFLILGASLTCYKKLRNAPHEKSAKSVSHLDLDGGAGKIMA